MKQQDELDILEFTKNGIRLSYSAIGAFLDCKRLYYLKYVENWERYDLKMPFFMGNVMQYGVYQVYKGVDDPVKSTMEFYQKERARVRETLVLTPKDEQDINDAEVVLRGMVAAYSEAYGDFVDETDHVHNELSFVFEIRPGLEIKIKMDNILRLEDGLYIHELKAKRSISRDTVKAIKNDLQTNLYFHICHEVGKIKPVGILYDIVRKPSIRQRKNESKSQFLVRLEEYYRDGDPNELFYMEPINKPLLSRGRIMNLIKKVAKDILRCRKKTDFYPNERFCYIMYRCDFFELCHYGVNNETMRIFRKRQYHQKGTTSKKGAKDG